MATWICFSNASGRGESCVISVQQDSLVDQLQDKEQQQQHQQQSGQEQTGGGWSDVTTVPRGLMSDVTCTPLSEVNVTAKNIYLHTLSLIRRRLVPTLK